MKKILSALLVCVLLFSAVSTIASCGGGEKLISVISREAGSGTRDAFESIVKDSEGNKLSSAKLVSSVNIQSKTSAVIAQVSSIKSAIGYVSLGSIDSSVKVLSINSITPTAVNVTDGSYKLSRPFVIMTNKSFTDSDRLTAATKDFLTFLNSAEAQLIVEAEGYVSVATENIYTAPTSSLSGTIVIKGSTSVDPLMVELIAKYKEIGGSKVSGISFDMDCQGSSYGISAAKNDTTGNVIGLNSSAVKAADASSLSYFNVALDAIAVIVNKGNKINNITVEQLFDIYTGKVTKFSKLATKADE